MNILFPKCPPPISASLAAAITPRILSVAGLAGSVFETGHPHQVYYIPPSTLLQQRDLREAKPIAWRVTHTAFGAAVATEIDLTVNPKNESVTAINQGPFAATPTEQLNSLSASQTAGTFEIRLLRLPEIKLMAIWLFSLNDNIIIPVAPVISPLAAGREYSLGALLEVLSPAIQRLKELKQGTEQ